MAKTNSYNAVIRRLTETRTQRAVAEELDVNEGSVSRYVNDESPVSSKVIEKLNRLYPDLVKAAIDEAARTDPPAA